MENLIITPLGTVSPYSKGNKNCPGFLVEYEDQKILLDCGNGITRLLNLPEDLKNMSIIISHLHKDHYGDLLSLGYASYVYKQLGILTEPINVYLPEYETEVTKFYGWDCDCKYYEKMADAEFLDNFGDEHYLNFNLVKKHIKVDIANLKISFMQTKHSIKNYAIKIETPQQKIVYSGDTGYEYNNFGTFAKDVDLFICESTFLRGQLKSKDEHLYAFEAAKIAKEAGVKQLMLTHFWPEIDSDEYVKEAKEIFENVIAAEEGKKLIIGRTS